MANIMHLVLGLKTGGLEKFVLDLVSNYPADLKPFIVCLEERGDLGTQHNVEVIELLKEPGFSLPVISQLFSLVKSLKIDIIHTHNPAPHFYGAVVGCLSRCPVIHTKHGRNYPTRQNKVWLNRISSALTQTIVAVSQDAAEVSVEVEGVPPSKVSVILNGIDTALFFPVDKKPGPSRLIRIGIVARLSAEKDHHTLLHACKLLSLQITNFHLQIIGDGPLREVLEREVVSLGLTSFVSFLGVRYDISVLLHELDVFVLSSTTEGISLTLLEAMASGLPVVATDVGGNPEVVCDKLTGYLVPPQDAEQMADKLLLLVTDPELRLRMGSLGRDRVLAGFSIGESAQKYEKLYRDILAGKVKKQAAVAPPSAK